MSSNINQSKLAQGYVIRKNQIVGPNGEQPAFSTAYTQPSESVYGMMKPAIGRQRQPQVSKNAAQQLRANHQMVHQTTAFNQLSQHDKNLSKVPSVYKSGLDQLMGSPIVPKSKSFSQNKNNGGLKIESNFARKLASVKQEKQNAHSQTPMLKKSKHYLAPEYQHSNHTNAPGQPSGTADLSNFKGSLDLITDTPKRKGKQPLISDASTALSNA